MKTSINLPCPGHWQLVAGMVFLGGLLVACRPGSAAVYQRQTPEAALRVVATTTILGDVVRKLGGDAMEVSVLVPPGSDPHSFQATASDIREVVEADLVITNGAGLDAFIDRLLESAVQADEQDKIISASDGIAFRQLPTGSQGENHAEEVSHSGEEDIDPHVWFDPQNVILWTRNIERALSQADPANASLYAANGEAYRAELEELDTWIEDQVATIPMENRKLVTDHQTLGYFADRFGFDLIGTVIPGSSAAAEPSAEDLATLIDAIPSMGVKAIFAGSTVSPILAKRVAADTGVQVVPIYTDSLTPSGGEASSYIDLMRYDVRAIQEALR